jgi:hypothetical protein
MRAIVGHDALQYNIRRAAPMHDHAHHHHHHHAHRRAPAAVPVSLLRMPAHTRLLLAAALIAMIWALVFWAVA